MRKSLNAFDFDGLADFSSDTAGASPSSDQNFQPLAADPPITALAADDGLL
ncbi:hypothetical protein D3C83_256830 [compost metagenome]